MPQNKVNYSTRTGVIPTPGLGAFSYNLTDRLAFYKDGTKTTRSWNMTTDAEKVASGPINTALGLKANKDNETLTGNVKIQNLYITNNGQQTFFLSSNSASPYINFDAGDYINFDQNSNTYSFLIGSSSKFSISSSRADFFVNFYAPNVYCTASANFYMGSTGAATPLINFDSNDYLQYDQSSNKFGFFINGTAQAVVETGKTTFPGTVIADNYSIKPSGMTDFALTALNANTPIINWDSNDFLAFERPSNTLYMYVNGSYLFTVSPTEINFNVPIKETGGRIFATRSYNTSTNNNPRYNAGNEYVVLLINVVAATNTFLILGEGAINTDGLCDVAWYIRIFDQTAGGTAVLAKVRIITAEGSRGYGGAASICQTINNLTIGNTYQVQFNVNPINTGATLSAYSSLNILAL